MPMAEDPEAAAQDASEADDAAMAARAEQQRVVSERAPRRWCGRLHACLAAARACD